MAVKIPILKIEEFLIASIQTALDDRSVVQFQDDLLERISSTGSAGVVVDITAVELVDSFMARSLNDIAVASHLLGAHMVVVGMQPSVAMTLVRMGLTVPNSLMALNLEAGLKLLRETLAKSAQRRIHRVREGFAQEDEPRTGSVEYRR